MTISFEGGGGEYNRCKVSDSNQYTKSYKNIVSAFIIL